MMRFLALLLTFASAYLIGLAADVQEHDRIFFLLVMVGCTFFLSGVLALVSADVVGAIKAANKSAPTKENEKPTTHQ